MPFLLYGAYGYTGRLITEAAAKAGLSPTLAGRNAPKLRALAEEYGFPHIAFDLEDAAALDTALANFPVVLHAAGPFAVTAEPMLEACLRTGTHYLDITGEIEVFAAAAARNDRAWEKGIMLMPGVGFDVVPTDCMAAYLQEQLPEATHLKLAFAWNKGGISQGTAKTAVRGLGEPGAVRRNGKIVPVPPAHKVAEFPFTAEKSKQAVTIPWGDVFTAYHTTGIPNIETYFAAPPGQIKMMKRSRYLGWLLRRSFVRNFLTKRIEAGAPGPNEERRSAGEAYVYGEVNDAAGKRIAARLRTPEGYTLTAITALMIVQRVLAGDLEAGYRTPALAYGADLILEVEGTQRELIDG